MCICMACHLAPCFLFPVCRWSGQCLPPIGFLKMKALYLMCAELRRPAHDKCVDAKTGWRVFSVQGRWAGLRAVVLEALASLKDFVAAAGTPSLTLKTADLLLSGFE